MNSNEIVGIRYVGKKDRQEDTVCKTGAIWLPGKVHNFGGPLAKALLVHTDSFERAPISADGGTFLTQGKGRAMNKQHDVAAFVNINGMAIDQLVLFARRELDRVVNVDGKDEAQIRREVLSLMTNHSLDQEAERRKVEQAEDGRMPIAYMATAEEFAAYQEGTVKLAIVPAEVVMSSAPETETKTYSDGTVATGPGPLPNESPAALPLPELLDSLEKPQLMEFARQEDITFSNNFSAEKLRERIFSELSARETRRPPKSWPR